MSIALPTTAGNIIPEYAAASITFGRSVLLGPDGFYVPMFTAQIAYVRQDFVVDAEGNRVSILQPKPWAHDPAHPERTDPAQGQISMDQAALIAAGMLTDTTDLAVFQWLSDKADSLIQADLVRRGLL